MVELDVFIDVRGELVEVAFVIGVEERGIERGDRAVEFLLVLNLVEGCDGLGGCYARKRDNDCQKQQDLGTASAVFHEVSLSEDGDGKR